ncbi:hypothetical protein RB653_008951 [Dictyostelium firmibasis]|uniref:Diaminopimelate epimerase n=1 Tax=Dictyostelium firmibasis TaxID=79012 RepID=A0AAN7U5H3_9MYCE
MIESSSNIIKTKYEITFSKMHGAGNDFIVFETNKVKRLDGTENEITLKELQEITLKLSHRKLGVGFDQAIIINNDPKVLKSAHYEMIVINSDGEQATMCGNGVRCFSKYIIDNCIESKSLNGTPKEDEKNGDIEQKIETLAGLVITYPKISHHLNQYNLMMIKVNMNNALILKTNQYKDDEFESNILKKTITNEKAYLYTIKDLGLTQCDQLECVLVSMGNPHCVVFLERNIELGNLSSEVASNLSTMKIDEIAIKLQKLPLFKDGCNVEFVSTTNSKTTNRVISRVFERGAGETLACGTGACGVAVASILMSHCSHEKEVTVSMPGGDLLIQWSNETGEVFKTGPACTVFDSKIKL